MVKKSLYGSNCPMQIWDILIHDEDVIPINPIVRKSIHIKAKAKFNKIVTGERVLKAFENYMVNRLMRKRDQINIVSFCGKEVYLEGIATIFKMDVGQ